MFAVHKTLLSKSATISSTEHTDLRPDALLDDLGERQRTRDQAERTIKAGVSSVPMYVINGRENVSGASGPIRVPWRSRTSARGRRVRRSCHVHHSADVRRRGSHSSPIMAAARRSDGTPPGDLFVCAPGRVVARIRGAVIHTGRVAGYLAGPRIGAALYNVAHSYV